jgi:large subunit ribosomal protein L18
MAKTRREARLSRHQRVRKTVIGSAARPRLAVFRSNVHIYAQIIDDATGHTLAAAGTIEPSVRESLNGKGSNMDAAKAVGTLVAERAKEKGVQSVVFDRSGYLYHGRVAALAQAARDAGLEF